MNYLLRFRTDFFSGFLYLLNLLLSHYTYYLFFLPCLFLQDESFLLARCFSSSYLNYATPCSFLQNIRIYRYSYPIKCNHSHARTYVICKFTVKHFRFSWICVVKSECFYVHKGMGVITDCSARSKKFILMIGIIVGIPIFCSIYYFLYLYYSVIAYFYKQYQNKIKIRVRIEYFCV